MGIEISTLHVRRSSLIQATAERVWREFTSFDRFAAWFGRGQKLEVYELGWNPRRLEALRTIAQDGTAKD